MLTTTQLVRITFRGSPIAGAIPVSPAVAEWAIAQLVAECPARHYDYDTVPAGTYVSHAVDSLPLDTDRPAPKRTTRAELVGA